MEKSSKTPEASQQAKRDDPFNHLLELITDVKFTMMTTQDKDGHLRSRPMQTLEDNSDNCLWFFTADHHGKAEELEADPKINLSYAMPEKNRYVSVSGMGEIVHDLDKKKELWKPAFKAWFPEGAEDSHCALLKVYVEKAEYWDTPSSTLVEIVGFTKAILTGKTYKPSKDSHQKVNFNASATSANPSPS